MMMIDGGTPTQSAALEAALAELLAAHPGCAVAAIGRAGLIVDLPPGLPLDGAVRLGGRSAMQLVAPAYRPAVFAAWERVKAVGTASATVQLRDGQMASGHLFDLTAAWDVYLLVVVASSDSASTPLSIPTAPAVPPRLCRIRKSETSVIIGVDEAASRMLGWPAEDLVGRRTIDLIHPDDQERGLDCWLEMLGSPGEAHRFRGRHLRADGAWMWLDIVNHNRLHDEAHRDVLSEMIDASDEMEAHAALAAREDLLNRLTEALPFGVAQLDAGGQLVYANDRLCSILGTEPWAPIDEQFAHLIPSDRARLQRAVTDVLGGGDDSGLEVRLRLLGAELDRICQVEVRPVGAEVITGVLLCVTDVTESSRLRQELEVRATVDDLTSCLNRASILDVVEWAVSRRDEPGSGTSAVFVDVDHFKAINDRYGHAAGDEVLREVGRRLQGVVRSGDRVGRLGGDEFLVVCPELESPELAMHIARRAAASIDGEMYLGAGVTVPLRVSLGVGWADNEHTDADHLVAMADSAMYESKRERAGRPVLRTLRPV